MKTSDTERKKFEIIEKEDLDFISGGAAVRKSIDPNLKKTFRTQKCNCGLFEPYVPAVSLKICDNCKWAVTTDEQCQATYCEKQSN